MKLPVSFIFFDSLSRNANVLPLNLISASGAKIIYGGARAFYLPSTDSIHMPHKEDFITSTGYSSSLCHMITLWRGHSCRLKRNIYGRKHSTDYASYVDEWLQCIRNDSNAMFKADADANRAIDYILTKSGSKVRICYRRHFCFHYRRANTISANDVIHVFRTDFRCRTQHCRRFFLSIRYTSFFRFELFLLLFFIFRV